MDELTKAKVRVALIKAIGKALDPFWSDSAIGWHHENQHADMANAALLVLEVGIRRENELRMEGL